MRKLLLKIVRQYVSMAIIFMSFGSFNISAAEDLNYDYLASYDSDTGNPQIFFNLIPDLSRIKLKDFGLNPEFSPCHVNIEINSGDIEPDIELSFDADGKLSRYFEAWDGEFKDYIFSYNTDNKLSAITVKYYWERDDVEDKTRYIVNFDIIRNDDGLVDRIIENSRIENGPVVSGNIEYKLTYDWQGKPEAIRCLNFPEVYWTAESGFSNSEYNAIDDDTKQGAKIWDSSLCHYYVNMQKDDIDFIYDPYFNWYDVKWEFGNSEGTVTCQINRSIEYYDDEYKGTMRGIVDFDKTTLEDFLYPNNSGIRKLTLTSSSAEVGTGFIFEFYPDGRLKSKSFFDDLDEIKIDMTVYYYEGDRLKMTVNRYMHDGYILEKINDSNGEISDYMLVAYPIVETRCYFNWDNDKLTGITENIISINNTPATFPSVHYGIAYSLDGRISEIKSKENPMIKLKFTTEGFVKQFIAYLCNYKASAIDEIEFGDVTYSRENIRSCDYEVVNIPLKKLDYTWNLRKCEPTPIWEEENSDRSGKPMWDYRIPPCYGPISIEERDAKGNWTRISYDCSSLLYDWGFEAEIEYY